MYSVTRKYIYQICDESIGIIIVQILPSCGAKIKTFDKIGNSEGVSQTLKSNLWKNISETFKILVFSN